MDAPMLTKIAGTGFLAVLAMLWSQRKVIHRTLTADLRKKKRRTAGR